MQPPRANIACGQNVPVQPAASFDRGVAICSDGLGSSEDPVMATPEPRQLVRSVQETARASGQASAESERHARDRASERHARDREEESGRAEDEETQRGGNERGSADVAEREGESLACSMAESVLARQEDALGRGAREPVKRNVRRAGRWRV